MRIWFSILGVGVLLAAGGMIATSSQVQAQGKPQVAAKSATNAYDFNLVRIDGKPMPLSAYKGKVTLLVNTASFCGFTKQFDALQTLHTQYQAKGFTVLGVPSGDFMSQEYDDNGKIKEFCDTKFGITFPMAEKAVVKGPKAAPLFKWVKTQITENNEPKWNFHKFVIGRDGKVIAGFPSKTLPDSPEIKAAIEKALKA